MAANTLTYIFLSGDGNSALATAKTAFNTALAAVDTYQDGPISFLNSGLEAVSNSQAAGVIIYLPWAFISYYSAS